MKKTNYWECYTDPTYAAECPYCEEDNEFDSFEKDRGIVKCDMCGNEFKLKKEKEETQEG